MLILFNDLMQNSDAPETLISPSLADRLDDSSFIVTLDSSGTIDCIGVGNTDATTLTINGEVVALVGIGRYKNGLYKLVTKIVGTVLNISHNGTYIGRMAAGLISDLGTSQAREPGYYSTNNPRSTLSGQVVPGAGGIAGRILQVDVKYKVTRVILDEFEAGFLSQISRGFPLFSEYDKEYKLGAGRMPWARLYGAIEIEPVFQSSVNKFLYSKKFKFKEAF